MSKRITLYFPNSEMVHRLEETDMEGLPSYKNAKMANKVGTKSAKVVRMIEIYFEIENKLKNINKWGDVTVEEKLRKMLEEVNEN
jgi:hypothetical protein